MASSLIFQVTILCTIISFPSTTIAANGEGASDIGLDHIIPGLAVLKDVDIWRNGEITSLAKTFGPNLEESSGNPDLVADMSSTALGCQYSSAIVSFIRKIENFIADADRESSALGESHEQFKDRYTVLKALVKSLQPVAGEMVTTALSYTKISNIRVDKNVLNAIMSFYMYFYRIKEGVFTFRGNNFTKDITSLKLYTRHLIDGFAVLNCPWSSFDSDRLNDQIDGFTIVSQLNLPETHYTPEDLDPNKLVLSGVWGIRLDHDYNDVMGTMAFMPVGSDHRNRIFLKGMVEKYMEHFLRSEIITQTQTRTYECIASSFIYLITNIIELSRRTTLSRLTESVVSTAVDTLKDLNFPGSLHVRFRKFLYQKSIYSRTPFRYLFEGSQCHDGTIDHIIDTDKLSSIEAMTDMLNRFTNDMEAMQPDIKTSIAINRTLCDYDYEEVGFTHYDTTDEERMIALQAAEVFQQLKKRNCNFSLLAVYHFKFIDYLVSQCEAILSGSNDSDTATLLESCFKSTVRSVVSVADMVDNHLVGTLDAMKSVRPPNNANRKVIDSLIAVKLYLNSDAVLNSRVPETAEQNPVDQVVGKLDVIKRYNRFVINLIEQYTREKCTPKAPSEKFTKEMLTQIDERCDGFSSQNDKTELINCVDGLIQDSLKRYERLTVRNIDRSGFTIGKLLMNDVLEMAASDGSNGLSMLHEVRISWEGRRKTFTEIVDIVKHTVNPKYLYKYQSFVMKAIVFTVYEKIKIIVQSSTFNDNFGLYRSNLPAIIKALNVEISDFFPLGTFRVYEMIVTHFQMYILHWPLIDQNALIRVIEAEQHFLGIQKDPSGTVVNEIVDSIPDHTIWTNSKSKDYVETAVGESSGVEKAVEQLSVVETVDKESPGVEKAVEESPGVEKAVEESSGVETAVEELPGVETNGLYNIEQLRSFMAVVENIRTSLTNVALIFDLRQMGSLKI